MLTLDNFTDISEQINLRELSLIYSLVLISMKAKITQDMYGMKQKKNKITIY